MPGSNWRTRNAAMTSLGFSIQRKTHSTSLTCAASRSFRPPYFDEWDASPCELYRKLVAMVPRTEQHRLPLQIDGRLGLFPLALLLSSMRIAAGRDRGFELVSLTEPENRRGSHPPCAEADANTDWSPQPIRPRDAIHLCRNLVARNFREWLETRRNPESCLRHVATYNGLP